MALLCAIAKHKGFSLNINKKISSCVSLSIGAHQNKTSQARKSRCCGDFGAIESDAPCCAALSLAVMLRAGTWLALEVYESEDLGGVCPGVFQTTRVPVHRDGRPVRGSSASTAGLHGGTKAREMHRFLTLLVLHITDNGGERYAL